jgi:hypothetical protein
MVDNVLVDPDDNGGDLSKLEKDLHEAVSTQKDPKKGKAADASEEEVPVKLRGKSLSEVAEMYANLESAYGRMANDLGTQRKMTDRLLDLKRETDLSNNSSTKKVEIKSSELLENPTEALEKFTAARESKNESRLQEMEQRLAQSQFIAQHPDYQEVAADTGFADWVRASPIRTRAAQAAHNGDWGVASELLHEYKAGRKVAKAPADDEEVETEDAARKGAQKASLESGSQGSSGVSKKGKVYLRRDLMRLRAERPEVWENEDFQREIISAYNEGRVK